MIRSLVIVLAVLAVGSIVDAAAAQPVSRQNPYRSFNISGVNYGSQQWERRYHHGRRMAAPARASWRWRR